MTALKRLQETPLRFEEEFQTEHKENRTRPTGDFTNIPWGNWGKGLNFKDF